MGWGGGGSKVWDRETMFSQLAKRSPCVMASGKLRFSFDSKYFFIEVRSEPGEEMLKI